MTTTDYCDYKLSLALKECGFDEPCDHFYEHSWNPTKARISASGVYGEWDNIDAFKHDFNAIDDNRHKQSLIPYCSAPTLWQAQKWLREKGIAVSVQANETQGELEYSTNIITTKGINKLIDRGLYFIEYEQALSAGIAAALELITKEE